jgi:hypothetical protein
MLIRSHLMIATALAIVAIAAPAATAMAERTDGTIADARAEHAAALADAPAVVEGGDQRSPDAVEPFVRPVVVNTEAPASTGFDWTSAIIGIAGGLALAVLAGAAVSGGRPRQRGARAA